MELTQREVPVLVKTLITVVMRKIKVVAQNQVILIMVLKTVNWLISLGQVPQIVNLPIKNWAGYLSKLH